jgi:hypothetical protein
MPRLFISFSFSFANKKGSHMPSLAKEIAEYRKKITANRNLFICFISRI